MTIHARARAAWAEIPVPAISEASQPARRVFVRDLLLDALIGIYPEERVKPQKILINLNSGWPRRRASRPARMTRWCATNNW